VPSWGEQAGLLKVTGVGQIPSIAGHGLGMGWPWTSWGAIELEKMHHQESLKWHYLLKKLCFS